MSDYLLYSSGVYQLEAVFEKYGGKRFLYVKPNDFKIWNTQLRLFARTIHAEAILDGGPITGSEISDALDARLCQVIYNSQAHGIKVKLANITHGCDMVSKLEEIAAQGVKKYEATGRPKKNFG